jgi:hypothetical protein
MLITEAMQTAVTPVFLLTGIGALLNVMMSRLGRIKDRERLIYSILYKATGNDYELVNSAMKKLAKRSILVSIGIWLSTGSALFVCLVIIFMFLGAITAVEISKVVATLFIICMFLLASSLLSLVYEVFLATRTIHKNEASSEVVITKLRNQIK